MTFNSSRFCPQPSHRRCWTRQRQRMPQMLLVKREREKTTEHPKNDIFCVCKFVYASEFCYEKVNIVCVVYLYHYFLFLHVYHSTHSYIHTLHKHTHNSHSTWNNFCDYEIQTTIRAAHLYATHTHTHKKLIGKRSSKVTYIHSDCMKISIPFFIFFSHSPSLSFSLLFFILIGMYVCDCWKQIWTE